MVVVDADTQVEETCCVSMSQIILRLKEKVEELKQNEHQLQLKDTENSEKLEKLTNKLTQMDAVRLENKLLKMEKEQLVAEHQESVAKLMEKHSQDQQDLDESITNQKRMLVSEKQRELEQLEQRYKRELHCAEDSKKQELEELALQYESQLEESVLMLRQVSCLQEVIDLQITEMNKLKDREEQLQSMIRALEKDSAELKMGIIQSYEAAEEKNQIIMKMKAETEELRAQKEQLTAECEESQKQELQKVTVYYEAKLEDSLAMLRQCVDRCRQQCDEQSQQKQQELEQMHMQLQEVDAENNHLRIHCDSLLQEQRETCMFLEDESALLRKEVRSLQERIACQTREMETLQEAVHQHWAELRRVERDNLRLRRRMRQKDSGNKQRETKLRDKT
ncbi:cilia- and flagella-associated protein 57-like [Megalops cyprinoides]|uniref:cilia- and flagella-associated protein 57-like n=1 Tax=Megalops cyprinoides TaxID=118141 RepID=UPI001864D08A|nr:cilia- and flagella-associated protein 57-like [Megalops cyprinoides]XP_036390104.1 cilia- and flagella-associated protein 57-like [Megalops cyprinoides]